ncbi:MAG: polysaccharide biosynthesis tyrosine autokinase [Pseudomonadota bacterium]
MAGHNNGQGTLVGAIDAFDEPGSLRRIARVHWRIVVRWRWLVLIVTSVVVASSAIYVLLQPPSYAATARLQIDEMSSQVVKGGAVLSNRVRNVHDLRTMHQVLAGRSIAKRVAADMKLAGDQSFIQPWRSPFITALAQHFSLRVWWPTQSDPAIPPAARERLAVDRLMKRQRVRPIPGSRLVDITYTDTDPERAARIANAFAQAFIDANLDRQFGAGSYAKSYLEDQLKALKLRLKKSEESLFAFAQREKILVGKNQQPTIKSTLAMARTALSDTTSRRIKAERQWRQVSTIGAINTPKFLTNTTIAELRTRKNKLEIEYRGKLETFKPGYPAMVRIKSKIAEIERQIVAEVVTTQKTIKSDLATLVQQERDLKARLDKLRDEALELQTQRIQYGILRREVDSNRELYNDLLRQHKQVAISADVGTSNVSIVDPATQPSLASSPTLLKTLVLALALGCGLGVGSAFLLDLLDDRVYLPEDIGERLGISVIGAVPDVRGNAIENDLLDPSSSSSEAYRSLATAMRFSLADGLPPVLCVSSPGPYEGKSISAFALARQFARMDLKVLLIDGDLRSASLHTKFGLPNTVGLVDFLAGKQGPPQIVRTTDLPNLFFISCGTLPSNSSELLASPHLRALFADGAEVFDTIIVDAPPTLGHADILLLADLSNFVLLVATAGKTQATMLRSAMRRLQSLKHPAIGVVLTRTKVETSRPSHRRVRRGATSAGLQVKHSQMGLPSETRPSGAAFKGAA